MSLQSKNITNKNKSVIKVLKHKNQISNDLLVCIDSLSLEDIIAIKLELSTKHVNNRLYGFDLWRGFQYITKEALLKFAISTTTSKKDAARFLGLTYFEFLDIYKRYEISQVFENTTQKDSE